LLACDEKSINTTITRIEIIATTMTGRILEMIVSLRFAIIQTYDDVLL
jgi:hypothetical protein